MFFKILRFRRIFKMFKLSRNRKNFILGAKDKQSLKNIKIKEYSRKKRRFRV